MAKIGSKKRPVWKLCLEMAIVVALFSGIGIACVQNHWIFPEPVITDRTEELRTAWRKEFGEYLDFPAEATLVSVKEETASMRKVNWVTFTLPETKNPKSWMEEMTEKKALEKYRVSDLEYDGGRGTLLRPQNRIIDYCRFQYRPAEKVYVFEVGYD